MSCVTLLRGFSPLPLDPSHKRHEHSPVVKVLRRRTELMVAGVVASCCHGVQEEKGQATKQEVDDGDDHTNSMMPAGLGAKGKSWRMNHGTKGGRRSLLLIKWMGTV